MTVRAPWLTPALLAAACLVAGLAVAIGSVSIPPAETLNRLAHALVGRSAGDTVDRILLEARLPRVMLGGFVGAALALAGLAAQTLFRNPLATPSVIGVSNGAALGAVVGMLLGGHLATVAIGFSTALSVLMGLAVATMVYLLGRRGAFFGHALLLAGIAIGAFCSSVTTAALYLAGERLQAIVFWLMGGLWQANWRSVTLMAPLAVTGLVLMLAWSRDLNLALLGERAAYDLGLNLPRFQRRLLILIAGLTAIAVSLTGVIGFIGLIVPHLLRLLVGADHRRLVLPTALGGAILLVLADLLARTLASPAEIPVGIFTALVGAPVFLWLLQKRRPVGHP